MAAASAQNSLAGQPLPHLLEDLWVRQHCLDLYQLGAPPASLIIIHTYPVGYLVTGW